jgi:hypothetical protein
MWCQLYKKELLGASDFQPHQKRTVTKYILLSLTFKLCESNKSVQSPDHLKIQSQGLLFFSITLLLVTYAVLIRFVCTFFIRSRIKPTG